MDTLQKEEIINTILSMPHEDRIDIIDRIKEGFNIDNNIDYDALWAEEADRRVEAYLRGEMKAIPFEEVLKEIEKLK